MMSRLARQQAGVQLPMLTLPCRHMVRCGNGTLEQCCPGLAVVAHISSVASYRSPLTVPEQRDLVTPATEGDDARFRSLRADCDRCFALLCFAPALPASPDFALTHPPAQAGPNLRADFRSGHHAAHPQPVSPGCAD